MLLIKGTTPQKLHNRQNLKFVLAWFYYPVSVIAIMVTVPKEWAFVSLLIGSVATPFAIYYLFVLAQPKKALMVEDRSSGGSLSVIAMDKIEALVFKRAVYRSRKLISFKRGKALYMVVDVLTIVSNTADRNIGVLRTLTEEEAVAFENIILPDNTLLFTEKYMRFPAPETILLSDGEFEEVCKQLSSGSGKGVTKLSGGNVA